MTLKELNDNIVNKKETNLYIFVGTEVYVMDTYINKICEVFNYKKILGPYKTSFDPNIIYIDRNNNDILKNQKCWNTLKNKKTILCFDSIDKRSSFFKTFEDKIVFFNKLPLDILMSYISQKSTISPEFAKILVECCNYDYSTILYELDKIQSYSKIKNYTENSAIIEFFEQEQLITQDDVESLKFASFLVSADVKNVYNMIDLFKQDDVILLLSTCYTLFKNLYLIQSYTGTANKTCEATGLNYYQVKNLEGCKNIYTTSELLNAIKLFQNTIASIKRGTIGTDYAIKYVVSKIL